MQLTTGGNISLKTTLVNFSAIWVKRSQKEEFFAPDKFDNHTTDAEKERAIEEEERSRREKEKKTVVTLLGFILATLEIIFVRNGEIGIGAFQILIV